ncbi:MAG: PKD domain-containing protein [Candidatus Eisenbacteria bacterium]
MRRTLFLVAFWTAVTMGIPGPARAQYMYLDALKLGSDWFDVDGLGASTAANNPPVITAPGLVQGPENAAISVIGSAGDPDGNLVTLSQTNNAPFFAAASSSSGPSLNPSITLSGTPNFTQAGSYSIAWTAVDSNVPAATASATTAVSIGGPHRNPVITAPATVFGTEGALVSITASAASPDGFNVTLCVANSTGFLIGPTCAGPAPNPSLTISGTPSFTQAGNYTITWTAVDDFVPAGTSQAATALTIADTNRTPALDQPFDMTVTEMGTATQQLSASDPDGSPLIFAKAGGSPFFMSVSTAGLVTLAPGFADAGLYTGTAMVTDGSLSDSKSFAIRVVNVNRCPIANAGGPYSGIEGVPLAFDGSGTSDPDGDLLSYSWDYGDLTTGAGVNPIHTYAARGSYVVTLTVDDSACQATASTTATIAGEFTGVAFTTGGNNTTSLGSGKPFTYVQVEPYNGAFNLADVNFASVRMVSPGTGSVLEIFAVAGKVMVDGDRNGNGVTEIRAGFAKADLRLLFSGLPFGTNTVQVGIEGDLLTGGRFRATLTHHVKSTGGALAATISPNPLNPFARLTFATTKGGAVRVELFDLNGRLVRTVLDERQVAAGYHDVAIDGRAASGSRLSSGVYFVKVWTEQDGWETKRLTILK